MYYLWEAVAVVFDLLEAVPLAVMPPYELEKRPTFILRDAAFFILFKFKCIITDLIIESNLNTYFAHLRSFLRPKLF